ncbi:MAG: NYN domain-containing protein [Eggerthellaceae bacterium]|nr:NYN domain-containing protein [Eggerthellaceae bacterium]
MAERKTFALLIDSDNVSARYIPAIMNELTSRHGEVTYRRIYGDWTSSQMGKWKDVLAEHSLTPMQQFANTKGKNATDSFLIIDAMDILYEGRVDGFCIVSSDSDFTRLASRLRDAGCTVVGMGEAKTPRSFRSACTVFTNLDVLLDGEVTGDAGSDATEGALTKSQIADSIVDIINDSAGPEPVASLSDIGNRLVRIHPDFDVRAFGYAQLSKFLESFDNFHLVRRDNVVYVGLRDTDEVREQVAGLVVDLVERAGDGGVALSQLGDAIHEKFPHFNVKDLGYSKLSKFMRHVDGVVIGSADGETYVYLDCE